MNTNQQLHKHDLVRIADPLPSSMSHFHGAGKLAIVMYSYEEKYGGRGGGSAPVYCLLHDGGGESCWYDEHLLTLVERNRPDLETAWREAREAEDRVHRDLDWIFAQGPALTDRCPSVSVIALAKCLKLTEDDLWGRHGEWHTFYMSGRHLLRLAKPYLEKHDKAGWLAFCEQALKGTPAGRLWR